MSVSSGLSQASNTSRPARLEAPRKLRILVAEDNAINQRFIVALLRKAGHAATVVENGHQAVAAVRDGDYDVVLMDVQMPDLDGAEATRQIRALPSAAAPGPDHRADSACHDRCQRGVPRRRHG